ncbi:MAG: toll/interleukin-1 receptor domain-containing protein [Deltaproteobacteria bacterium]|jgi:hypothetical protein|nr:toll/interleukin-1 receptor domain-containing protein [Deltaproteobacteria bacterium]
MPERKTVCNVVPCSLDDESFVFVSYAHFDSAVVFPIIEGVSADGYAIWYDKGISISSTWTDEIATAILNCSAFVIFITKESAASVYVRSEIEFALNNRVKVVPVYLDGMDVLPPGLALGLNATQGITDAGGPESIARNICAALEVNKVEKKGAATGVKIKYKKYKKRRWGIREDFLRIAAAGVVLMVAAFGISSFILRSEDKKGDYSFTIEKRTYAPAEPVFVELPEVTRNMLGRGAIVGIARAGDRHGEYISFEFIADNAARIKLRAPAEAGKYEVRGYNSGNDLTEATLAGAVRFSVSGDSSGAFGLTVDRQEYAVCENIEVKVAGVPKYMLDDGAELILSKIDAPPEDYISHRVISARDAEFTFGAPEETGEYVIRAYSNNDVYAESTIVAKETFSVIAKEAYPFTIEPDKLSYAPESPIVARVSGVPYNLGGGAIITLSGAGGGFGEYISSERIYARDATITLKAPPEAGEYELRGYWDRSVLTESGLAVSVPFRVDDWGRNRTHDAAK